MIIKHKRQKENADRKFAAAIQGIDLNKDEDDPVQKRIEEVQRRAAVKLKGEEAVQQEEFAELGFGYETA